MRRLRRLIINADDFGISRGVNDGIVQAAKAGGITSTSVMVNLPDSTDALTRARQCPGISVGLHFNLTVGNAISGASSLTYGTGAEFYSLSKLLAAASLGMLDETEIERECLAQIDRMTRAGFPPTHLDSHRHVHTHPAIYPAVLRAVQARRIPHLRVPCEPLGNGAATRKRTPDRPPHTVAGFLGISVRGGAGFGDRLFELIRDLPAGTTELMTHPGYADATLTKHDNYAMEREIELEVLCSSELRNLLHTCRVTLANFGDQTPIVTRGEFAESS
jgi:predicted glycoside hydrolase/deacetylase ChbG (UPF0249 family)